MRAKASSGTARFENVVKEFNDKRVVVSAEDTPKNINYFSAKDLAQAGVARTELRALAVANLKRLIREPQIRPGKHATMITAADRLCATSEAHPKRPVPPRLTLHAPLVGSGRMVALSPAMKPPLRNVFRLRRYDEGDPLNPAKYLNQYEAGFFSGLFDGIAFRQVDATHYARPYG
jgi:hypothetical protein